MCCKVRSLSYNYLQNIKHNLVAIAASLTLEGGGTIGG